MQVIRTDIPDVCIIEPDVFGDERGFFMEIFQEQRYTDALGLAVDERFVQDNVSVSKVRGTLRGLHYQAPPFAQGKLVQVFQGTVLDVAVDIRFGSPTYGKYVAVELSALNKRQFFIPRGFAHGYLTLTDNALFTYKCTNIYSKEHDRGVLWNDPAIGIDWPIKDGLILSDKDQQHPLLSAIAHEFTF